MKKNALIKKLVGVILEANEKGACIWFNISGHVDWIEIHMAHSKNNYKKYINFPHSDIGNRCIICIDNRYTEYDSEKIQDIIDFISNKYL